MDTRTIADILGRQEPATRSRFDAVYASDKLPKAPEYGKLYVINTAPSTEAGEHWVAVYVPERFEHRHVEYYDPLGMAPFVESIEKFLLAWPHDYVWNQDRVQSWHSITCGQHCIFFLSQRCMGISMADITTKLLYPEDPELSDELVNQYVEVSAGYEIAADLNVKYDHKNQTATVYSLMEKILQT